MLCQNIQEVILALEKIVAESILNHNPTGFFAVLYWKVTKRVESGILQNEFDNNELMERLDVIFANRYLEAYHLYKRDLPCALSWKVAFDACEYNQSISLQHLIAGINAHINLDLGIAAVETVEARPLEILHENFFQINSVLANMIDEVKADLARMSTAYRWLFPLVKNFDEKLMQFSIEIARDSAWQFANKLYNASNDASLIHIRDKEISKLGLTIFNPSWRLRTVLKTIRMFIFKQVGEQIILLKGNH